MNKIWIIIREYLTRVRKKVFCDLHPVIYPCFCRDGLRPFSGSLEQGIMRKWP